MLECTPMADTAAMDAAVQAQLRRFRDALANGMPRLGWKVGINDPKVLERLGLDAPVFGWLAGDRALRSGESYVVRPGTRVALEAEVAVRVGGGGTIVALAPAFEIVNFAVAATSFEGVIEHDLFHDAVVLGRDALPVPIAAAEWPVVRRNGEEVARRDPELLVLQPGPTVRRAASMLARFKEQLESGDWIILGSLVRPIPIRPGDRFEADFGPLGRIAVQIAEET